MRFQFSEWFVLMNSKQTFQRKHVSSARRHIKHMERDGTYQQTKSGPNALDSFVGNIMSYRHPYYI